MALYSPSSPVRSASLGHLASRAGLLNKPYIESNLLDNLAWGKYIPSVLEHEGPREKRNGIELLITSARVPSWDGLLKQTEIFEPRLVKISEAAW